MARKFRKRRGKKQRRKATKIMKVAKLYMGICPNYKRRSRISITCGGDVNGVATGAGYNFVSVSFPINYPTQYYSNATWNKFTTGTAISPFAAGGVSYPAIYDRFLGSNSLWDMYKVKSVTVRLLPMAVQTSAIVPGASGAQSLLCYHLNDYDDYGTLASSIAADNSGITPHDFATGKGATFRMRNGKSAPWFNSQNYDIAPTDDPITQKTLVPINSYGSIKIGISYRAPAAQTQFLCGFQITWDMVLRGFRDQAT